jgi:predicted ribosomally synthesized peptide with SipW-like signal peptide
MEDTAPRARRTRLLAIAVAGLAVVSMSAGAMSLALFTDTETVDGTFSSGTIVLDAAKVDALSLTTSLMPGDQITDDVVVENDGTAELRYDVSAASVDDSSPNGGALYEALTVTVNGPDVDLVPDGTPCDDFDGSEVLPSTTLGATTTVASDRVLASGGNETLCFRVALPDTTGDAYQGAATTTTFTFAAEQTANNP